MTSGPVPGGVAAPIDRWEIPTPFPVGPVNAYRLPGASPALVDAGPRTPDAEAALAARLKEAPVDVLVLTHEHVDHMGLARTLQSQGVKVWVHASEAATLRSWTDDASERERDYQLGLETAGVPPDLVERMRKGGRKYDALADPVQPDRVFRDGERLLLGDATWTVVDAPGHTPGSFLLTDGARTFTGDTVLERITPNALSVRDSERGALVRYLATLEMVAARGWGLAHPGHGAPFREPETVARRGIAHLRQRQSKVAQALAARPHTVYELVRLIFPTLADRDLFLGVSEVRGHLELLVHQGHARRDHVAGVDRYALEGGLK